MKNILDLIPYGKEKAITREELEILTGHEDRTNRAHIKEACIKYDEAVISLSQGKGYYKAVPGIDNDNVVHQITQNVSAATSRLENNKPLRNWLAKVKGQQAMSFEDSGQRKMSFEDMGQTG